MVQKLIDPDCVICVENIVANEQDQDFDFVQRKRSCNPRSSSCGGSTISELALCNFQSSAFDSCGVHRSVAFRPVELHLPCSFLGQLFTQCFANQMKTHINPS